MCVNVDNVWFANNGVEPPQTLLGLTKPEYEGLFVTPGAATSSPGMSFLLATIGAFGPGEWQPYWEDLMANGTKQLMDRRLQLRLHLRRRRRRPVDRVVLPFTIPKGRLAFDNERPARHLLPRGAGVDPGQQVHVSRGRAGRAAQL